MSQEYKSLTGVELIKGFCSEVLAYGVRNGLNTDGVKIWLSPQIAKTLELKETLVVECQGRIYELPLIIDESIIENPLEGGQFQSDIRVGNPEWKIDRAEGELWYEI